MSGRGLARLAPLVPLALVTALGLTACGDGGDTDPPAGGETSSATVDGDSVAMTVTRDGVPGDRPVARRSWYRHTEDWLLVTPRAASAGR